MRFVKLATVFFLLAIATVGSLVVIAHVIVPEMACLLYDTRDDQGGNVIAIDPTNGNRFTYHRAPTYLPRNPDNGDVSPDDTHQMYLTGSQNGPYNLYIDPKPLKRQDGYIRCFQSDSCWIGEHAPNPQARMVAGGLTQQFMAIWLDNERIAYSVPVNAQEHTLIVERIDGSTQYRMPLTFDQRDKIDVLAWDDHLIVFTVDRNGTNDAYIWSLPDGGFISYPSLGISFYRPSRLSPQGKYVVMMEKGRVVVLSTEKQERVDFALQNQDIYDIEWAPDEQHIAIVYQDTAINRQKIIYGIDGTQIARAEMVGSWSNDGQLYFYLTASNETRDLMVVHVDGGQLETIANDVNQLYGVLDNGQILALWGEGKQYTLGTLDPETKTRHIITNDVTSIGDIKILHSGHTILYMVGHGAQSYSVEVINSDGGNYVLLAPGMIFFAGSHIINEGKSFLFYAPHDDSSISLEMIDLDGSNHRTFVTGLEDVRYDIVWSRKPNRAATYYDDSSDYPDYMVLTGKRNGSGTVEFVDLHTGDHRILAQGFANLDGLQLNSQFGGIGFFWEYTDHEDGFDVYSIEGEPIVHLLLPGDYSYSSDYQLFRYFPSSNKDVVAVIEQYDSINLYFMAADSSWQKQIEVNLGGVGDGYGYAQAWSPDGKQFAFSTRDPIGHSIRILDEHGDELHRFTGFTASIEGNTLLWTHCE